MKYFITFLFLFTLGSCSRQKSLSSLFPHIKMIEVFGNKRVIIDKEFQEKAISGMKINFEGEMKSHQLIVEKISDITTEQALILFKNKSQMIRGMYSIQATPYTGAITKEAGCLENIQTEPITIENKAQISAQFNLKATARFVLGVCAEEQNIYHSQTLLLFCKNRSEFYEIKYFYPKYLKSILNPIAKCQG